MINTPQVDLLVSSLEGKVNFFSSALDSERYFFTLNIGCIIPGILQVFK